MTLLSPTAMVLAAGRGVRMQPLTLATPKPLLQVGGRAMLDHALDKLQAAGINQVVVNSFYLGDQIEAHIAARRDMTLIPSPEQELLDTGGGVKHALRHFTRPFFALNADLPWTDGAVPGLARMKQAWQHDKMDVLLLLMPTARARGFEPKGDFALEPDGRVHRHDVKPPRPCVWISAQILKPELFAAVPEKVFSNNVIWDRAEERGRLYGILHDGTCYHVGTPGDLEKANQLLASGQGWQVRAGEAADA